MGSRSDGIKILQWNARSINSNGAYLNDYLCNKDFNILCLQSLFCKVKDLPNIQGFCYPPFYKRLKGRVAVATYVRTNLIVSACSFPDQPAGVHLWTRVVSEGGEINILNCYYPEGDREGAWLEKVSEEAGSWLIAGDFNSRSVLWEEGCQCESATFRDRVMESDLVILNDGSFTRIPDRPDHNRTAIDLSLASPDLAGDAVWEVGEDPLSSDHLPILIKLACEVLEENTDGEGKFNYEGADWEAFREALGTAPSVNECLSCEQINTIFTENVLKAANLTIPKTNRGSNCSRKRHSWWNAECKAAVQRKRKTYKIYRASPTVDNFNVMQEAKINCKRVIANAKKNEWSKFVYEVKETEDLSQVFKKFKKMKSQYNPPDPILEEGGIKYVTRQAKAEKVADVFEKASSLEGLPPKMREFRDRVERDPLNEPVPNDNLTINKDITEPELDRALNSIKKLSVSEGPDSVSYRMLRELPGSYRQLLLILYRKCWAEGIVPAAWKQAIVAPILKAGKPRRDPGSYRPISLTSHVGKIYERIVKERLTYYAEKRGDIPNCQAGFRRGRGVVDHLSKIAALIRRARARNRTLFSCFFDVRRAYDSVWHRRILEKLANMGLSGNIFNFVRSFIQDRTIRVKWRGAMSSSRTLQMGVPQGSVIAPLLFNLVTADISKAQVEGCSLMVYADDIAVCLETRVSKLQNLNRNPRYTFSKKIFQRQINNISDFLWEKGFTLSPQKTTFFIATSHRVNRSDPLLSVNVMGEQVAPQANAKYLGVTFSANGSWEQHISSNALKAQAAVNIIKMLSRTPWASATKTMITLVQSLVRSRLLYGLEAFFEATPRLIEKLRVVETKALKIALGLPQWTPVHLVYREAGILPLGEEIRRRLANHMFGSRTVPNSTTLEDFRQPTNYLNEKLSSMSATQFVSDIVEGAGVREVEVAVRSLHETPPWTLLTQKINPCLSDLSKQDNPQLLATITRECISQEFSHCQKIYTDGSLSKEGVGAAFYAPTFGRIKKYKLPDDVSIFTAELIAIYMALHYISTKGPDQNWVILSDSRSVLEALRSDGSSSREDLVRDAVSQLSKLKKNKINVTLQWIPSHVGIAGNEKVDGAAKEAARGEEATSITQLPLSLKDIKNKLKRESWSQWRKKFEGIVSSRPTVDPSLPVSGGVSLPALPLAVEHLIHRLRCGVWRAQHTHKQCKCGGKLSPHHIIFECAPFKGTFDEILRITGRPETIGALLVRHSVLGWQPAKLIAETLLQSELGRMF